MSGAIGQEVSRVDGPEVSRVDGPEVSRVDGPAKVTGAARYSGEIALPGLAHAEIVGAGIASGRITSIDTTVAERAEGVASILTHLNTPKVNTVPLIPSLMAARRPGETFFPMQDDVVHYAGQPVAVVVADSLGQAQHAATLVHVSYAQTPAVTTIGQGRVDAYEPDRLFGGFMSAQIRRGNAESGFAAADLRIDAPFRFAANHHNPLEALTTTAAWDRDQLTLYDSCQGVKAVQLTVAALLGISPSRIRVLTRYVGGAFGSKAMVWPHVTLTAWPPSMSGARSGSRCRAARCSPPAATARSRNSTSSSGQPATAGSPRSATARSPSPPRSMTGPSPPSASPPSCMPALASRGRTAWCAATR
jgi:xanthine dehydrogenase YagR molybdenum-binding subunit